MRKTLFSCVLTLLGSVAMAADYPQVLIETTAGSFVVELDDSRAPLSSANFLKYVESGFYNGTIFHRVVPNFVIQGGGYTPDLNLKPTSDPVPNESGNGLSNARGTIAMARTSEPHSADSQFYINIADNGALDPKATRWGYAVFGRVVGGMLETVDEIAVRPTGPAEDPQGNAMENVPGSPVIIENARVLGADERL